MPACRGLTSYRGKRWKGELGRRLAFQRTQSDSKRGRELSPSLIRQGEGLSSERGHRRVCVGAGEGRMRPARDAGVTI